MNAIERCLIEDAQSLAKRLKDPELAQYRLAGYRAKIGVSYQCPACFVLQDRVNSALSPLPTKTRDDAMVCDVCDAEFLIVR